jgi:hypothetical protein
VLNYFNYSIKASEEVITPPLQSRPSTSSLVLATPYTAREIYQKALSIKKLLYKGSRSPTSPSKRALDELIKGCELAIYNTVFILKEMHDLRAEYQV